MRKRSLDMVHALARRDERVVFIGSDLSPNLLGEMKKEFPSRYYMEGIAEANVIGMAAGMAMEGFVPYVNTIATFITRRCYEQVAVDLCLHDLPVRLIGNGGGYVYAPLGPTHQAIEDIAIMRALPHMTVTAVCDAEEMTRLMDATLDWPHPIYIRLGKGGDPVVSKPERGFKIGKAIDMIEAEQGASDVLFVTTGVATTQALKAAGALAADGIRCRLLHAHTIKPLDVDAIVDAATKARLVVTVEEHSVVGGLGSAVLEALSDAILGPLPPLKRLGIPDRFSAHYGSQQALMEDCNIDAKSIASTVRKLAGGLAAMSNAPSFWRDEERALADAFVRDGYVILPTESREDLDRIRDLMADIAASYLKLPHPEDKGAFLDRIHEKVDVHRLNDLRLAVIREMNEEPWTRLSYFNTARRALEILVGNELAMQLRINLSIQLPNDDSSLLPVHADVWSGDSPYEVVLWIPYVDVYGTKTMFILPREQDSRYQARMSELKLKSAEELYRTIEPDLRWLDIPYGNVLLFTQNVMHGNIVNREPETRWSSNCRFKSVFSPYHDKKLGEFFEPILVRPATKIGASYRLPSVS